METNEQWKLEGKCSLCRRRKYCSKSCKAHNTYLDRRISQAFSDTPAGRAISAFSEQLGKVYGS